MPDNSTGIVGFEPLLQAAPRLQVMAVLVQAQQAEFSRLKELTSTSDSVMSKHLSALADAGFLKLSKATANGRQRTWASITGIGRKTFQNHIAALQRIIGGTESTG
jgi:DNA-binding MarR family transcriptional regulator